MKKWIIGIIAIAVVAAGAYLVLGDGLPWAAASETDSETVDALPVVEAARDVVAEAKVVPVQYATLSLPAGGIVGEACVSRSCPLHFRTIRSPDAGAIARHRGYRPADEVFFPH